MTNVRIANVNPEAIGLATRLLLEAQLAKYPSFLTPDGFTQRIERFAAELARWGVRLNLTASPDDPAELTFHILDSLMPLLLASGDSTGALADAVASAHRILDLGSGAGFPGLVLAAAAKAEFVLMEARRRRASFLNVAAGAMGLANVRVDNRHLTSFTPGFDLVTARAFTRPIHFYELAPSAIKSGGSLILYASSRQKAEIERLLNSRHDQWTIYEYEPPHLEEQPASSAGLSRHMLVVSRSHD